MTPLLHWHVLAHGFALAEATIRSLDLNNRRTAPASRRSILPLRFNSSLQTKRGTLEYDML